MNAARRAPRGIDPRIDWVLAPVDVLSFALAVLGGDLLVAAVSGTPVSRLVPDWGSPFGKIQIFFYLFYLAVILFGFWARGHYATRRSYWEELREVVSIIGVLAVIDTVLFVVFALNLSKLPFQVINWLLAMALVFYGRLLARRLLARCGLWLVPTYVFGCGAFASEVAEALSSDLLIGVDVRGFLAPPGASEAPRSVAVGGRPVPVHTWSSELRRSLVGGTADHVVVALEEGEFFAHRDAVERLSLAAESLSIISPVRGFPVYGVSLNYIFGREFLVLRLRNNLRRPFPQVFKRLFDLAGSIALLVLLAPVFLGIGLGVRRSGRPIFYGHQRVGRYDRPFTCYKFRTMLPDAEQRLTRLLAEDDDARAEWERDFKLRDDPRITRLGAFLRRTSLDELPQLWNVLRGDMSLVGPRPIVEEEKPRYADKLDYYLMVRPGVTGWWQISGRNETGYAARVALDTWYVKNWSLWYDIVILLKTVPVVLRRTGAY